MVDHGKYPGEQEESYWKAQPPPQAYEQLVEIHHFSNAPHQLRPDQHQRDGDDHHEREDGTAETDHNATATPKNNKLPPACFSARSIIPSSGWICSRAGSTTGSSCLGAYWDDCARAWSMARSKRSGKPKAPTSTTRMNKKGKSPKSPR